jgi:hypothetical protein
MISKKDIMLMAKHVLRRSRGVPDRNFMHPARDWAIGLVVSATVFSGGAIYLGYLFFAELHSDGISVDTGSAVVSYKQKEVSEALTIYSEQKKLFELLRADQKPLIVSVKKETSGTTTKTGTASTTDVGLAEDSPQQVE